jgi:branched-chain amino acid transport system permease protein
VKTAYRRPGQSVAASSSRLLPYPGVAMLALLLIAGIAPIGATWKYLLTISAAWGIAAVGLDLSTGLAGQALFGQTAFVAMGAYGFTIIAAHAGGSVWLDAAMAIAATGIAAAIIGSAMVRLRHLGAVLVTFFFAFVVAQLLSGTWLSGVTGGENGLPSPAAGLSASALYYTSVVLLAVTTLIAWNYRTSRSGRALRLIKRNEAVAQTVGINPAGRKLAVFVMAAMFAALTGVLLTISIGFISPETFDPMQSIILFAMIALGGIGSISGGILGAVVLTCLPSVLHGAQQQSDVIYALILLLVLVVRPDGVMGIAGQLTSAVRRRTAAGRGAVGAAGERLPESPDTAEVPQQRHPADREQVAAAGSAGEKGLAGGTSLVVEGVGLAFGGVRALDGVSLSVASRSVHAIIGPNGAGKTSLLNCICGIEPGWTGKIAIGEMVRTSHVPARRIAAHGVARTFQNASLVMDMSALENVALGLYARNSWSAIRDLVGPLANGKADRAVRVAADEALDLVGITRARRLLPIRELSLAEAKLTDIARAIAPRPRLLLLDEPTAGLSGAEIERCAGFISELNSLAEITTIVVSHHVGFVRQIADRATVLDYGKVIGDGSPQSLLEDEVVVEAFLGSAT